jgi:Malonyl-CoA decarboxylase C-terminal domain
VNPEYEGSENGANKMMRISIVASRKAIAASRRLHCYASIATRLLLSCQPSGFLAIDACSSAARPDPSSASSHRGTPPLSKRSFSNVSTTTTISSFGNNNNDNGKKKKKVELPSLSESELLFIQELFRKLPAGRSATNDSPLYLPLNNSDPKQITNVLLQLRANWLLSARGTADVVRDDDADADAVLSAIFDRVFAPDQFDMARLDNDNSQTDLLRDMLTRDRVHPIQINAASAQQQQQQQQQPPIRSITTEDHDDDHGSTNQQQQQQHHVYGLLHHWSGRPAMLLRVFLGGPDIPFCLDQIFFRHHNNNNGVNDMDVDEDEDDSTTTSTTTTTSRRRNNVATFYSISLLENGWSGLGLGERFLHDAMGYLRRHHGVDTFVTLSPMPHFREWLLKSNDQTNSNNSNNDHVELGQPSRHQQPLVQDAFRYLVHAKDDRGLPYDPVARFHLSNGAELYRIHHHPSNLPDSYGWMVNYRYDLMRLAERKASFPQQLAVNEELLRSTH